jgi:hypothetical protein
MGKTSIPDEYTNEEVQRRFEAALRGAREVGHEPMKDIPPKRPRVHSAFSAHIPHPTRGERRCSMQ